MPYSVEVYLGLLDDAPGARMAGSSRQSPMKFFIQRHKENPVVIARRPALLLEVVTQPLNGFFVHFLTGVDNQGAFQMLPDELGFFDRFKRNRRDECTYLRDDPDKSVIDKFDQCLTDWGSTNPQALRQL